MPTFPPAFMKRRPSATFDSAKFKPDAPLKFWLMCHFRAPPGFSKPMSSSFKPRARTVNGLEGWMEPIPTCALSCTRSAGTMPKPVSVASGPITRRSLPLWVLPNRTCRSVPPWLFSSRPMVSGTPLSCPTLSRKSSLPLNSLASPSTRSGPSTHTRSSDHTVGSYGAARSRIRIKPRPALTVSATTPM